MAKKIRSEKNFWGETVHYDESGKKVGVSRPNSWGGMNHYDSSGAKVGESHENFWGGTTHRDAHGNKTGESNENFWGGTTHYDSRVNKVGESYEGFLGGVKTSLADNSPNIYHTTSNAKSAEHIRHEMSGEHDSSSPKRGRSSWFWDSGFIPMIIIVVTVNLLWRLFILFCESR